jgi:calcium-dependent protein kinase
MFKMPRTGTDAIQVTPSQFILENSGVLSGNYQFCKKLGQGTYGIVYMAIHKTTKEKRAIKMISKTSVPKNQQGKLINEISVLKEMDHPSIMRIFEFASDDSYFYVVGEYFLVN